MSEAKTYPQMRNDFYKNFRDKCYPLLLALDKERKQAIKNAVAAFVFIISLPFCIFASLMIISGNATLVLEGTLTGDHLLVIGLVLLSPFIVLFMYSYKFKNKVKKVVMPVLCKCFDDLKWIEKPSVNHSLYMQAGIVIQQYNTVSVDDVFEGSFKGVTFDIVEVDYKKIKHRRSSNGKTSTSIETIFDGIIVTLDMNKNFSAHTLVKTDSLLKISCPYGLKRTALEDVVFEKKFDVYTNDEVEARYLLTSTFMEKLTNMKNIYNTSDISCAFYKNKLIIGMNIKRDAFNVGSLFKSTVNEKPYFQMYEEVISIMKLIEYLKLDQKIGL